MIETPPSFPRRLLRACSLVKAAVLRKIQLQRKRKHGRAELKRRIGQTPLKIVIGANGIYDAGWIPTDIEVLNLLRPSEWQEYFTEHPIDAILAEHVWEHLTGEEAIIAATTCFRFLRPGGYLRVAVPDGLHPDPTYIERVRPNGTGPGAQEHKVMYTHNTFRVVFEGAGFEVVELEHFDKAGEFHFEGWNPEDGRINRSKRFDVRNQDGRLTYTSIILDARKPLSAG
jgi:predicted SAM-dependent methyltransferase